MEKWKAGIGEYYDPNENTWKNIRAYGKRKKWIND